jgi:flagellar biosynthesis chaperone FliJ
VSTLSTLHRLRQFARQESDLVVARARTARDEQAAVLEGLRRRLRESRDAIDPADAGALAGWHAWRLRVEMEERREGARLAQRERDLDMALRTHQKNVRDELSLEKLIEIKHEEARVEAVRAETRVLDEVGSRRSPA